MKQVQIDNKNWVIQLTPSFFREDNSYSIIEVEDNIFEKLTNWTEGYKWRYSPDNNNFQMEPYDLEYLQKVHLEDLRFSRKLLLQAFDIYKTNVFYGIESDTNHDSILTWYQAALDLNEEAINTPPQEISKYIQ